MKFSKVLIRSSALVPLTMSSAAIATFLVHVARYGTAPQADGGVAAHLWQLLMVAQVPIEGGTK
jgi:hypothetical protein